MLIIASDDYNNNNTDHTYGCISCFYIDDLQEMKLIQKIIAP